MRKFLTLLAVLSVLCLTASAQNRIPVKGKVLDEAGQPVPFATVRVKGDKQGVSADGDGNFAIKVTKGSVLIVNAVGYAATESVTDGGDLSFHLKRSGQALSEVVVSTAFGVKKSERTTPYSAQVVKSETLNLIPQTNLADALAGKVAGVQFRSQSPSKLNSQSFARIRGGLLIDKDVSPIYVVDGTILSSDGDRDGSYDIDPATVESVTVLKGANATALFGSKASNGAIVVTTKKGGVGGRSLVTVTQSVIADRVSRQIHSQNRYAGGAVDHLTPYHWKTGDPNEWKTLEGVGFPDFTDDSSWGPEMLGQDYAPWYAFVPGTKYTGKAAKLTGIPNNTKDFWNTGLTSNTNVSFTKGGQGYTTRLSYSKQYIRGLIPNTNSNRDILSGSFSVDMNKFISAGADINYNSQMINGQYNDGYANGTSGNFGQWNHRDLDMKIMKELRGLMTPAGTLASWNWARNPDGYSASNPAAFYAGNYWYNFYAEQDNRNLQLRRDRLYGDAYIKLNPLEGLTIKGTVRKDQYQYWQENTTSSLLEKSGAQTGVLASFATGERYQNEMNYEMIATYNHTFFKDLAFNILGGWNTNTYTRKTVGAATAQGLNIPNFYAIANSKAQPTVTNDRLESKTNSAFGTGDLEYKRFVSATWAIRKDWVSTLPVGNNSLFYPSAGVAFVPSEMVKTMPSWLSFAKVFGSWGRKPLTLDIYQTNSPYAVGQNQWSGNFLMSTPGSVPDSALRGALITTYEGGVDLRFFNNRLGISVTYYNENAKEQPVKINVDAVSGIKSKSINAATVTRKGFEFAVNAAILKTSNFSWNVTATLGYLMSNKVTKIIGDITQIQPTNWIGSFGTRYASAFQVKGKDWGQLIGGGYTRADDGTPLVNPTTGIYATGDANYDWGSIVPKVTGGLQNLFTYKNFVANASLDYQVGGRFFSLTESWGIFSGITEETAVNNDKGKSVRDPVASGGGVHVKGISSTDKKTPVDKYVEGQTYFQQFYSQKIADPFVHKLSFVKLREVSLGYQLPVKKWGFATKFVQSATASVVARNLWLIYSASKNFDPSEISDIYGENGQLPPTRSLGVNLSFTF